MTRSIRVLHLEDSPRDAEMIHDTLTTGGVSADITLVTSKERFEAALAGEAFDLILSDYNVPASKRRRNRQHDWRVWPTDPLTLCLPGSMPDKQEIEAIEER